MNLIRLNIQRFGASMTLSATETNLSTAGNTSAVKLTITVKRTSGSTWWDPAKSGTAIINGKEYKFSISLPSGKTSNSTTVTSDAITHDADGSKTVSYSASLATGTSAGTISNSGSIALTKIAREFTSMTFAYVSKTETTITYKWTTAEDCSKITGSGGGTVAVTGVPGKSGNVTFSGLNALTKYTHSITATRKDSGLTTTKSAAQVETYNNPYITSAANFTMGNNTTVSLYNPLGRSVKVDLKLGNTVLGTVTTTSTSATISNINIEPIYNAATYDNDGKVTLNAVSPNNSISLTATAILPNITSNVWGRTNPTDNEAKNTDISGTFYNGNIGNNANTVSLRYRYKDYDTPNWDGVNWISIGSQNISISGNKFSVTKNALVIPIEYTKRADVEIEVKDISKTKTFSTIVSKGQPVFWVEENAFGITGDLKVYGRIDSHIGDFIRVYLGSDATGDGTIKALDFKNIADHSGDSLSLSNGKIYIGDNVKVVRVTLSAYFYTNVQNTQPIMYIHRNSSNVRSFNCEITKTYNHRECSVVLSVNKGDLIEGCISWTGLIKNYANSTFLIVEVIK